MSATSHHVEQVARKKTPWLALFGFAAAFAFVGAILLISLPGKF